MVYVVLVEQEIAYSTAEAIDSVWVDADLANRRATQIAAEGEVGIVQGFSVGDERELVA